MKKHICLLIMFVMIFIFVTGCDNSNIELPSFEELAKINQHAEVLKTHSNFLVSTVQKSDVPTEDFTEDALFFRGNGKVNYHLRKKLNSQDFYYESASRLDNYWYYSLNDTMFSALELGDEFFFDYTINDIYTCIPVGKPYIEDNMIVYHTYLIKRGYDGYPARRDDFTYYFNLETKLTEKITGVQYNENHEVLSTYENIFTYDVKEYFAPTLYENIINSEEKIKLEIIFDYNTPKQEMYEFSTLPKSLNLVYYNKSAYKLYTDSEYTNQVTTLEEYSDVSSLKLYAKMDEYSE